MSPKSKGRPAGRGKRKPAPRGAADLTAELLRSAARIDRETNVPDVEYWASTWLGQAWAGSTAPDDAETGLCSDVADQARRRPDRAAAFALAALRRVAPPSAWLGLDEALAVAAPQPVWAGEPEYRAVRARVATDSWDSERLFLIDYEPAAGGGPDHGLFAQIVQPTGPYVAELDLLTLDSIDLDLVEVPIDQALAQLAEAMFRTDLAAGLDPDFNYAAGRALAWSRCRSHYQPAADPIPMSEAERARLLAAVPEVPPSIAEHLLDYANGYRGGEALLWGPLDVRMFLHLWLPTHAILTDEECAAVPAAMGEWLEFVARERGLPPSDSDAVQAALAEALVDFDDIYQESTSDPVKLVFAELQARGIDINDEAAVAAVVKEVRASLTT